MLIQLVNNSEGLTVLVSLVLLSLIQLTNLFGEGVNDSEGDGLGDGKLLSLHGKTAVEDDDDVLRAARCGDIPGTKARVVIVVETYF